jgi:tetratricopeptide (TPR) repeat protein
MGTYQNIIGRLSKTTRIESPTIEFLTDTGRRIVCQSQVQSVVTLLQEAEALLSKIIESEEEPTIVAIQQLRDLAWFLDKLKLEKECRLVGNCALRLAQAHALRSEEFRADHADTLVAIGLLSSYSARAHTLFAQALLIGEEIVNDDPPPTQLELLRVFNNKCSFTHATKEIPGLAVQWFGRAVQIGRGMTVSTWKEKELCLRILLSYRESLHNSANHATAAIIEGEALALHRSLASRDPAKYHHGLSHFLVNYGATMSYLNHLTEALCLHEEAVALARTSHSDGSIEYDINLARALQTYGITLHSLNRYPDALATNNEALSIYRRLANPASTQTLVDLANMLYMHQFTLGRLNHHADAVATAQEAVSIYDRLTKIQPGRFERELSVALHSYGGDLWNPKNTPSSVPIREEHLITTRTGQEDPNANTPGLAHTIHDMAISLHTLGRASEADAVAAECLRLCNGTTLESCQYEPDLSRCFVCRRMSGRT